MSQVYRGRIVRQSRSYVELHLRATSIHDAEERMKLAAPGTEYITDKVDYFVQQVELYPAAEVLGLPVARLEVAHAYREYVRACVEDDGYNIMTLPSFGEWKQSEAVSALIRLAELHGLTNELNKLVKSLLVARAATIQKSGLSGQIEALVDMQSYEEVRDQLLRVIAKKQPGEWKEPSEPLKRKPKVQEGDYDEGDESDVH